MRYLDFTSFYIKTQQTTKTNPFTDWDVKDSSLLTTTSVVIKLVRWVWYLRLTCPEIWRHLEKC